MKPVHDMTVKELRDELRASPIRPSCRMSKADLLVAVYRLRDATEKKPTDRTVLVAVISGICSVLAAIASAIFNHGP